jgi:hypothetical protein
MVAQIEYTSRKPIGLAQNVEKKSGRRRYSGAKECSCYELKTTDLASFSPGN